MSFKFEIKENNQFVITDTTIVDATDAIRLDMPKADAYYRPTELKKDIIFIYDTSAVNASASGVITLPLSDCVDEALTPFTKDSFREWANLKLGFDNAPIVGANQIIVKKASDFGVIDSTKEYFLDGWIDMTGVEIEVPESGIFIRGYNFDLSGMYTSADNFTMFKSPIGGSGDVLFFDMALMVTGTNSKVFDLTDSTGQNAIEVTRINYINCTSLGDLTNYRQGLEVGTGRFGGSPSLCLIGTWLGGYRATTTIVRNMSDTTTEPIFKAGVGFVMNSRFLTDINVDLGTLQPLFDFSNTNFPNPSTLEVRDAIITRDGLTVPNDANITPNITASNLSCSWKDNNGIPNTFVGGIATVTAEVETVLTQNLPFVLLGTFTNSDLQHFDSPSNGQLRHLGTNPREFTVNFDFVIDGSANQTYKLDLIKYDGTPNIIFSQRRIINNLQGGGNTRDYGAFTGFANVILNQNEYVYWQITNLGNNGNCTLELDSSWSVEER